MAIETATVQAAAQGSLRVALASALIGVGRVAKSIGENLLRNDDAKCGEIEGLLAAFDHIKHGLFPAYAVEHETGPAGPSAIEDNEVPI